MYGCIEFFGESHHTSFARMRNKLKIYCRNTAKRGFRPSRTDVRSSLPKVLYYLINMIEDNLPLISIRSMATAVTFEVSMVNDLPGLSHFPRLFRWQIFESIPQGQIVYYELCNPTISFIRRMAMRMLYVYSMTAKHLQRQKNILDYHRPWFHALQMLELSHSYPSNDMIVMSAFKVSYYAKCFNTACTINLAEGAFDVLLSGFEELLHHAKIALDSINLDGNRKANETARSPSNPAVNFTFNPSLIHSLFYTPVCCQWSTTCSRAVTLGPPHEGL